MNKVLPTKFDEIVTNSPLGVHVMGLCDPEVLQAIKYNGGYVLYINHDCRLQSLPDKRFILTGLYLGEVDAERWTDEQAQVALQTLPPRPGFMEYASIEQKQIFCYTLSSGQRLLHIQNVENGWESFLLLISHVRFESGQPQE